MGKEPREGAGPLPVLLLDQGQLPRENSLSTCHQEDENTPYTAEASSKGRGRRRRRRRRRSKGLTKT
jgi:hypothetical protein